MDSKVNYKTLLELIYNYEVDLLKSEVRKSADKISELISDDFIEFTSSGKVAFYEVGEVFQDKSDNTEIEWDIRDFSIRELSNECVLSMYKVIKHNEIDENKKYKYIEKISNLIYNCL